MCSTPFSSGTSSALPSTSGGTRSNAASSCVAFTVTRQRSTGPSRRSAARTQRSSRLRPGEADDVRSPPGEESAEQAADPARAEHCDPSQANRSLTSRRQR